MKRLFIFILLFTYLINTQATEDTLYIYKSDKVVFSLPVAKIDSIKPIFTKPSTVHTKAEMLGLYNNLYTEISSNNTIEEWALDYLVLTETRSDNSYRGAPDPELLQFEQHSQSLYNKNIYRNWIQFYKLIRTSNQIICTIDSVQDVSLTNSERKQWKSEALILRAMIYFDMVRLWGEVPLILDNKSNYPETYSYTTNVNSLFLQPKDKVNTIYKQIIEDLTYALQEGGAPKIDNTNKFKLSRTVANAMLAKVYAEMPFRDYAKVIEYCTEVEKDVTLVPNYGDLFDMNATNTDLKNRNTSESIFEITFSSGGNWLTWMYGIDASDLTSKYDWEKWSTPSRDLLKAFDDANDIERKKQSITTASVNWNTHYPSSNYPFIYKYRSKFHSIIKLRLADILLLKAEAYVNLNNNTDATLLVNKIRMRAKLPTLTYVGILEILNERRLELAFEGQRWFDLVRNQKVIQTMNTLENRDSERFINNLNEDNILLPIPQFEIDTNPLLKQNSGY